MLTVDTWSIQNKQILTRSKPLQFVLIKFRESNISLSKMQQWFIRGPYPFIFLRSEMVHTVSSYHGMEMGIQLSLSSVNTSRLEGYIVLVVDLQDLRTHDLLGTPSNGQEQFVAWLPQWLAERFSTLCMLLVSCLGTPSGAGTPDASHSHDRIIQDFMDAISKYRYYATEHVDCQYLLIDATEGHIVCIYLCAKAG